MVHPEGEGKGYSIVLSAIFSVSATVSSRGKSDAYKDKEATEKQSQSVCYTGWLHGNRHEA